MSSVEHASATIDRTASRRIDAVLPLLPQDVDRARRLLIPTMLRFLRPLGTCYVVVPDESVDEIASTLGHEQLRVVGEHEITPELRWFQRAGEYGDSGNSGLRGWFVQQAIKLSMARVVETPFYITFDADVLCCREIGYDDLVPDGRGLAVVSEDGDKSHEKWYERSARVLDMPRSARTHGVTPAVLCREGVLSLFGYLERRLQPNQLRAEALLLSHVPWTEYSLYYTYLEHAGLFDRFHQATRVRTYANNVWGGHDPDAWDPAGSFGPSGQFFSVLQSHTVTDIDRVVTRIRQYVEMIGAEPLL